MSLVTLLRGGAGRDGMGRRRDHRERLLWALARTAASWAVWPGSGAALGVSECTDAGGSRRAFIAPGLINLHHHCYSMFSRGLNPGGGDRGRFATILDGLWWRLDRALSAEAVPAFRSDHNCRVRALRLYHRGGPPRVHRRVWLGVLDTIAEVRRSDGAWPQCCATKWTDRNGGGRGPSRGLRRTVVFCRGPAAGAQPRLAGMIGLPRPASPCADASAGRCGCGPVVVASAAISHVCRRSTRCAAVAARVRSRSGGASRAAWLCWDRRLFLAHGIHLDEACPGAPWPERRRPIVHAPESNANNGVWPPRPDWGPIALGCGVGLGNRWHVVGDCSGACGPCVFSFHRPRSRCAGGWLRGSRVRCSKGNVTVARTAARGPRCTGCSPPGAPADMVVIDAPTAHATDSGQT